MEQGNHLSPASDRAGKGISPWNSVGSPCLCGENTQKKIHHRDTEVAQRTTEFIFPTDSFAGFDNLDNAYLKCRAIFGSSASRT